MRILNETNLPCIYKITNLINGKIYIGQSQRLKRRIYEHCYPTDKTPIGIAIQKYGEDNFEVEVIATVTDAKDLNMLEKYYIEKFLTYYEGYNATKGGQEGPIDQKTLSKKVIQFSYDYSHQIYIYDSLSSASLANNISDVTIHHCCIGTNGSNSVIHAGGFGWLFENYDEEILKNRKQQSDIKSFYIYQLNKDGQPILESENKSYNQKETASLLGINTYMIKRILGKQAYKTKSKTTAIWYTFSRKSLSEEKMNA